MNTANHQNPAAAVVISYKKPAPSIVLPNPEDVLHEAVRQGTLSSVINKPRATVVLPLVRTTRNDRKAEIPIKKFFNKEQIS